MKRGGGLVAPWVWLSLVLSAVIGLGIQLGVIGDILSPSVWIDIIALWPVAAVGLLAAPVVWLLGGRRLRHLAIGGLSLFTWLSLGLALHLSGSSALPVSAASVMGPATAGVETARLEIGLDKGTVDLSGGSDALYEVRPIRAGGEVGAPTVFEQSLEARTTVVVAPRVDPGAYVFRGWMVALDSATTWSIDVAADRVAADVREVPLTRLTLTSSTCEVHLGQPSGSVPVELAGGSCRVYLARDIPASFVGQGAVPGDWSLAQTGVAQSPAPGDGWTISGSDGGVVEVRYE